MENNNSLCDVCAETLAFVRTGAVCMRVRARVTQLMYASDSSSVLNCGREMKETHGPFKGFPFSALMTTCQCSDKFIQSDRCIFSLLEKLLLALEFNKKGNVRIT